MTRTPPRALTLVALGALLAAGAAPSARADAAGSLSVASADAVALDGDFSARFPSGHARVVSTGVAGEALLLNATGTVRVATQRTINLYVGHTVEWDPDGVEVEEFEVRDATVRFAFERENQAFTFVAGDGGALVVAGRASASGHAVNLTAEPARGIEFPAAVAGDSGGVAWAWEPGWQFLGEYESIEVPLVGFPALDAPVLSAEGAVAVEAGRGDASFVDADGVERRLRLGNWTDGPDAGAGGAEARAQTRRTLVFEGTLGAARVPLGAPWGAAAPSVAWTLDGTATWTNASGAFALDGRVARFSGATLEVRGTTRLAASAPDAASGVASYGGDGEWSSVALNGARIVRAPEPPVAAAAATASLLVVLASLLFEGPRALALRVALALFTRIAREDLLQHPRRARIMEVVRGSPGVHLRELHRTVGGGWGIFRAHFDLLVRGGYLRVEAHGKYGAVYPAGVAAREPAIANATARAVYAALPATGAAVPVAALRERVDASRQLVNYHLRELERRGLVALADGPDGERRARRAAPGAAAPAEADASSAPVARS